MPTVHASDSTEPEAYFLAFAAFVLPFVGNAANRGTVVVLVVAGLFGLAARLWQGGRFPRPPKRLGLGLAVLLGYCVVAASWSITPLFSLEKAVALAALAFGAVVVLALVRDLGPGGRTRVGRALVWGHVAFLAVAVVGYVFNDFAAGLSRPMGPYWAHKMALSKTGAAVLALTIWPALVVLWRAERKRAAVALMLGAVAVLGASEATAPQLAVAVGVGALVVATWSARVAAAIMATVIGATMLALPLLGGSFEVASFETYRSDDWRGKLPYSTYHRLVIHAFTAERIAERPILGWGLEASRALPGGDVRIVPELSVIGPDGAVAQRVDRPPLHLMPLHPHNLAMQIWVELGAVGAVLATGLLLAAVGLIARHVRAKAVVGGALALAAAWYIQASFSFGAWQAWWLASLILAAAFVTLPLQGSATDDDG